MVQMKSGGSCRVVVMVMIKLSSSGVSRRLAVRLVVVMRGGLGVMMVNRSVSCNQKKCLGRFGDDVRGIFYRRRGGGDGAV